METFEVLIYPYNPQDMPPTARGPAVRSATVRPTGEEGATGHPRYAGDGVQADIDPTTGTVEAITVDGAELEDGWSARVADA
ncbi:hypothetical protein B4N89_38025 [Embleya scabrispora]|uniref:Uncharacterized protein n=1 Tax=Embleya scabrispora TaxID=159449 RepID=A0A1T3NMQ7_9ACTN|nr:hypothetical protein [Embleya scabrispora]OPC78018.1 hypothetical protein B4N89_38025 [Embleya scabrispora]